MAVYVQASIGASLGLDEFPRLTFDGFKKRKFEKRQPWNKKYRSVKNISQISSPAIKRARSLELQQGSGDCLLCNGTQSGSLRYGPNRWLGASQDTLLTDRSARLSSISSSSTNSQSDDQKSHCHSDSCLKKCDLPSDLSSSENKPSIAVINSHSSLKCGTNIKTWFIKVALMNVMAEDTVSVEAQGEIVKLKIKYGKKTSGIDRIFGFKQQAVKKHLKFSGTVDPSSLRTRLDTDGHLIIQMVELLNY